MIRQADINDLSLCVSLANKFIDSTKYKSAVDQAYLQSTVEALLNSPHAVVFLYDDVGFIAGALQEFRFGPQMIAAEVGWWIDPNMRSKGIGGLLLEAFENWAKEVGADYVTMVGLGNKEVEDFYIKQGYSLAEYTYMKEV